MSEVWNKRTDEYGGNIDKRMRFPLEIVTSVRSHTSPDFPIIFRLSIEHHIPGGRSIAESQEIAKRLEAGGVDAIHADAGCYDAMDYIFPPVYMGDACLSDMAAAIKQVVKIPVIAVGNMTPETGEALLESGKADFIALGRGLIADADWPNKLLEGRREDVRPCIRCNEQCIGRLFAFKPVSCAVNARAGSELFYPVTKAECAKKVLVIGGGPAGMETARIAALRGHKVTLMEKSCALGGQLRAAATSPFKKELRQMIDWWATQLGKLGVCVKLGAEATPETVMFMRPDVVVVATGAQPLRPNIPGIDCDNVVEVIDYHLGCKELKGQNIIVAGGGLSGCDAALELAMAGKSVTIVEMLPDIARDMNSISKITLMRKLSEHKVKILTGHKVMKFNCDGLVAVNPDGKEVEIKADSMVLAFGLQSDNALAKTLKQSWHNVYIIGDCVKPAKVGEAVRSGFMVGWQI